jgi:hypothetical protein
MNYIQTYENYRKEKYNNKKLIIIDIQPSYKNYMDIDMNNYVQWLNEHNYLDVLYLFNGPDLGMESEYDIQLWLNEYDLDENLDIRYYEKNYGFFRDFMDEIDDKTIILIGKYFIQKNIVDIRELSNEEKKEIIKITNIDKQYLTEDYSFYIPELKDELLSFINKGDKPLCIGGGEYECYKEVILLLEMLDFEWDEESQFIY